MRNYLLIILLMLASVISKAQTIDKAKDLLKGNELSAAKAEIDNVMKQEKNQKLADAWYTKSKIYTAVSYDANLKIQFPAARVDAFTAMKRYTELDDKMFVALQIDGYKPINDIYTGFYQDAAIAFNDKSYEQALKGFANAIVVSSFMNEKKWISLPLDTNSVLYAGVAAEKLNRYADAAKYYGMIADAKVKGEGFVEIYKWVANYYFEQKNYTMADKMIGIGKEVYPADNFWISIELDMTRASGNKDKLFKKYEEILAADPNNHLFLYNYAVELYQHAYNTDISKRPANSATLLHRAAEKIGRVLELKPEYAKAQLFAGQISYNAGVDVLKTNKQQALMNFDAAIPNLEKAQRLFSSQDKLTADDKDNLKEALDLLITIYDQKGMQDKVKEYQAMFNEVGAK